jgi:prepilin-type N-terminal cleavage/methylation domain-containing protein
MEREPMNRRTRSERGYTLTEMIIVIVILGLITGALTGTMLTALNGHKVTTQRVKESADAQIIAGFLVRDAQAAGGSNPATGAVDPTIGGVSLTDNGGCSTTGTLLIRFKWTDELSSTVAHATVVPSVTSVAEPPSTHDARTIWLLGASK